MMKQALKMISDAFGTLGIEYDFGTYTKKPVIYPYFVGEYQESEPLFEDGHQISTFLLNGFARDNWIALEDAKESIENYFDKISGRIAIAKNGNSVVIFYANTLVIPTGDAELKRIQIKLNIHEWKVS